MWVEVTSLFVSRYFCASVHCDNKDYRMPLHPLCYLPLMFVQCEWLIHRHSEINRHTRKDSIRKGKRRVNQISLIKYPKILYWSTPWFDWLGEYHSSQQCIRCITICFFCFFLFANIPVFCSKLCVCSVNCGPLSVLVFILIAEGSYHWWNSI